LKFQNSCNYDFKSHQHSKFCNFIEQKLFVICFCICKDHSTALVFVLCFSILLQLIVKDTSNKRTDSEVFTGLMKFLQVSKKLNRNTSFHGDVHVKIFFSKHYDFNRFTGPKIIKEWKIYPKKRTKSTTMVKFLQVSIQVQRNWIGKSY
jgi:hypothetical protein